MVSMKAARITIDAVIGLTSVTNANTVADGAEWEATVIKCQVDFDDSINGCVWGVLIVFMSVHRHLECIYVYFIVFA